MPSFQKVIMHAIIKLPKIHQSFHLFIFSNKIFIPKDPNILKKIERNLYVVLQLTICERKLSLNVCLDKILFELIISSDVKIA